MANILAIDQALTGKCGFAVVTDSGDIIYTHLEDYKGIAKGDVRGRCYRFGFVLQNLINQYSINVVVTEIVRAFHYGKTNATTISLLSQLQGVMNVVVPRKIPVYLVNTRSWQSVILAPTNLIDVKK